MAGLVWKLVASLVLVSAGPRAGALALVSAVPDLDAPLLCTYLRAPHNLFYPELAKGRGGARGNRISVVHGTYTLPEPLRALGVDLEGRVAWARVVALNIGGSNPYCWASSIKSRHSKSANLPITASWS